MKVETEALLKVASKLKSKGFANVAARVTEVGDVIEEMKTAQELIDADCNMIETAFQEVDAANQEIDAAAERKKKWVKGIDLKKGRLTEYKKPDESMEEAAQRALNSKDPSVRGMGSFFLASRKFKKKKKKDK